MRLQIQGIGYFELRLKLFHHSPFSFFEGQVRPLLRLISSNPEKAAEVWKQAAASAAGIPTERHVREALEKASAPATQAPAEPSFPTEAPSVAPEPVNGAVRPLNGTPGPQPLGAPLTASLQSWMERVRGILELLEAWRYREGLVAEQRLELREKLRSLAAVNREIRSLL